MTTIKTVQRQLERYMCFINTTISVYKTHIAHLRYTVFNTTSNAFVVVKMLVIKLYIGN